MNKRIFLLLLICLLTFLPAFKIFATDKCSKSGYTILTINGIFTDEQGAKDNAFNLRRKIVISTFNNQPLAVDYLYNATHLAGLSDLVDVVAQKLFYETSDYDLTNMLNDMSSKVKTEKVLLVAHSQGNFYANDIYDSLASRLGGIPSESVGVYGVASPADKVSGGGSYLTSSNDKVINLVRMKGVLPVLKANTTIVSDDVSSMFGGHDFINVYLKYKSGEIVKNIKDELSNLKNNAIQNSQEVCVSPQKLTLIHNIKGFLFALADPTALFVKNSIVNVYDTGVYLVININGLFSHLYANVIDSFSSEEIPSGTIVDNSNKQTDLPVSTESITESTQEVTREDQYPPLTDISNLDISIDISTNDSSQTVESPSLEGRGLGGQNRGGQGGGGGGGSIRDTIPPVITISGVNPMTVVKGVSFTDPGATANDDVDGSVQVSTSGTVDTSTIGAYTITYSATDVAGNTSTATRTIDVALDAGAPVITLNGNSYQVILKNSTYVDPGAIADDLVDGNLPVVTTGAVDPTTVGVYTITYSTTDSSGNTTTATRTVKVSSYQYVSKYKFGNENGDGNDWQAWEFNGSTAYDWTDTYVNNYLHEQFKIKTLSGFWCGQCLQRGIFNHDPRNGFESSDLVISGLENNPQNNQDNKIYNVSLQWDSTGYTYTISQAGAIFASGHENITNMNNDLWVGWDGSYNNFQTFPSGNWIGAIWFSEMGRTGGDSMVLEPFPVYKSSVVQSSATLSIPNKGVYTTNGVSPTRGRENLTPFNFEIIYTDPLNIAPQNIRLITTNTTTNTSLPPVDMLKIIPGVEDVSDGSFVNGEAYVANNITYDLGNYEYYFTATDGQGGSLRLPASGVYRFQTIPSTYMYIPKYTFGQENGDGNNWQAWAFNGSTVYDWSDTYVNNYLLEQFKIKTIPGGYWCSQCLQRGIFNHDPQKGFETSDLTTSFLENSPQNNSDGKVYDVSLQWDSSGYTYAIFQGGTVLNTGHTSVQNINEDTWVGWGGSFNNFQTFPSGNWVGSSDYFPTGYTGGSDMILEPFPVYVYSGPVLSNEKKILSFDFTGLSPSVTGTVDENTHTVALLVPFGTNVTNLVPTISISTNAQVSPVSGVTYDFTSPVIYTVAAQDNSTQDYLVTVTILPASPDATPPSVTSYTFNGSASSVTINPSITNPLVINLNSSENVNWMSIKIENQADNTLYKMFMSDSGACIDGTSACTKNWDGTLSSGGLLQSGVYKIKLHMKDLSNNEFYDYLTPYVINVDTTI